MRFARSSLVVIFGAMICVFGCTTAQKTAANKALNATTQPIQAVQTAASNVAVSTPPGSLPNDLAQIVMAITGSLLVLERLGTGIISALPEKKDGSATTVADVVNTANAVQSVLTAATSVHPSIASANPNSPVTA